MNEKKRKGVMKKKEEGTASERAGKETRGKERDRNGLSMPVPTVSHFL